MGYVNPNRMGIVLAVLMAAWHGLWTLLVATGVAQPICDFVLRMHFMKPDVVVQPFEPVMAVTMLAAATGLGYVAGAGMALLWNCLSGCYRHEPRVSSALKQSAVK